MPIEVVTAILVAVLGAITIVAAYVGILGATGNSVIQRCTRCGHMTIQRGGSACDECGYCRHDRLLHPLWTIRHADATYWATHRH